MATVTTLHAIYAVMVDEAEMARLIKAVHEYIAVVPPREDAAIMTQLRDRLLNAQDRRA